MNKKMLSLLLLASMILTVPVTASAATNDTNRANTTNIQSSNNNSNLSNSKPAVLKVKYDWDTSVYISGYDTRKIPGPSKNDGNFSLANKPFGHYRTLSVSWNESDTNLKITITNVDSGESVTHNDKGGTSFTDLVNGTYSVTATRTDGTCGTIDFNVTTSDSGR